MANRDIHTPSYLATARAGEFFDSASATFSIASGWYRASTSTRGEAVKVYAAAAGWTVGFLFKYGATGGSAAVVLEFLDGATSHVDLRFNSSTGLFSVTRNGTILLTSVTALALNTEYYVELQVVIADSPSGVAILKVDGVTDSVINSSALDTRNAGNASADRVSFGVLNNSNALTEFKDVYVNDSTGGVDDTFWGPIYVPTLVVQSDDAVQWTPSASSNASNVDDAAADGDTTYNATSTNGHVDTYTASDTGYASGTVLGVAWVAEVRRTEPSGTARVARAYKIGGTTYVGADLVPRTTYRMLTELTRVSPATGVAWTLAELDAMKIGIKRTAA